MKNALAALVHALVLWVTGLKSETVLFAQRLWGRAKGLAEHVWGLVTDLYHRVLNAVTHVALVPVHAVQWVIGMAKATGHAVASVWQKK